jgi:hypothetical protein
MITNGRTTDTQPTTIRPTDKPEPPPPADLTTQPIADVQALIARADTKASILFGFALAALTGITAVAGKAHLSGLALAGGVLTACLIAAALVLLGMAIRPAVGGNHGFLRWADAPSVAYLKADLADRERSGDPVCHLWLLARSARRKYLRVRLAVDLLGLALASAGLTALLHGLGW